jgi:hypothetical protein
MAGGAGYTKHPSVIKRPRECRHPCLFDVDREQADKDACASRSGGLFLVDVNLLSFLHRPEMNDERCSLSFPK